MLHLRRPLNPGPPRQLEEIRDEPLRVMRLRSGRFSTITTANLWATTAALRRLHHRQELPHLLHAHEVSAGLAALLAGRALRIPVVVSEHSSDFATGDVTGVAAHVARLVFAGAEVVCPVSESLRLNLAGGRWGGRYQVVPNSVDTDRFRLSRSSPPKEPPVILTVAALDPVKGIEELVEALALLRSRQARFRAVLAGDGVLAGRIAAKVEQLRLGDHLTLLGSVPHDEIPTLMHAAAFLVIPSRWETFSVAASEATACGLPVVATAVGALNERIHAGNGLLCPPRDPVALATAIETMLGSYLAYDRRAIAAEASETYSPAAIADRWEGIYAEVLARRGTPDRASA